MNNESKDLPLMSNTDDILVEHYVIFLICDFDRKVFDGKLYINLKPRVSSCCRKRRDEFTVILDSKDIIIDKVEEVYCDCRNNYPINERTPFPLFDPRWSVEDARQLEKMPTKSIHFQVEEWCLEMWKDDVYSPIDFPRIVCIHYTTTNRGASITWVKDQDQRDCCFTPGVWINNRALLPCQEPPIAMATWQAFITAPRDALVIMSGDKSLRITDERVTGNSVMYFENRIPLPIATLALAIGYWKDVLLTSDGSYTPKRPEKENHQYCYPGFPVESIACRMIASVSVLDHAYQELGQYIPKYLRSAIELLGLYPFPRLDVVVLPRCFDCLGMASPNVIFISQSLLPGDGSMRLHIAHELSHAWFGLLIGASDWTEEWLSEGFATYMEDLIHGRAVSWDSEKEFRDWMELRAYLRYRTLVSELEVSSSDLQTLSVSNVSDVKSEVTSVSYVKNGMNSEKKFLQVHYLKGYFLLKYLSDLAGEKFNELLKDYIRHYRGQLIHSQQVIQLFFNTFPHARDSSSIDILNEEWLTNPGLPKSLKEYKLPLGNSLYDTVCTQVEWWRVFNKTQSRSRKRVKIIKMDHTGLSKLTTEQLVLLLEMLLNETKLYRRTLRALNSHYDLERQNATIRHRWCELVIKYDYSPGISAVERFLLEDQGMGVYLYGELMVSEKFHLQTVARQCWERVQHELSPSTFQIVKDMIDG